MSTLDAARVNGPLYPRLRKLTRPADTAETWHEPTWAGLLDYLMPTPDSGRVSRPDRGARDGLALADPVRADIGDVSSFGTPVTPSSYRRAFEGSTMGLDCPAWQNSARDT